MAARVLTPKQERFVAEYLISLNAADAYRKAGYVAKGNAAEVGASRLLRNAKVAAAIAAGQAARSERTKVTQDYVIGSLVEVVERCMQRAPVMVRQGREVVQATDEQGRDVWRFDAVGATGALGLLGKHLGMFAKDNPGINVNVKLYAGFDPDDV